MKNWLNNILVDPNKSYPSEFRKENYSLVKIDSRQVSSGDIFLPFQGENINSHLFLPEVSNTVSCFFYDKEGISLLTREQITRVDFTRGIEVTNTLQVLPLLCLGVCRDFIHKDKVRICSLTGSVGKTTTRSMVVSFLSHLNPLTAEGNFNNEIGVPLTVLKYKPGYHKCVILEFGARHLDDISYLCSITEPDITSCINVYSSHLQEFKSIDNIYEAKSKIFNWGEVISTLGDDSKLKNLALSTKKDVLFFGTDPSNNVRLLENKKDDYDNSSYISVRIKGQDEQFRLSTYHTSFGIDLVAALSIALRVESDISILKKNISSYSGTSGRFELIQKKNYIIINDCYNASYESVSSSLKTLCKSFKEQKIIILGDMLELGAVSKELHLKLIPDILANSPICLICIGPNMKEVYDKLSSTVAFKTLYYNSVDELDYNELNKLIIGKVILIKASHSMNFSRIVNQLS